jgi:hypothetical protein
VVVLVQDSPELYGFEIAVVLIFEGMDGKVT